MRGPTHEATAVEGRHARHQARWMADAPEGQEYPSRNALLGKSFVATQELAPFAWRPAGSADLWPPIYIRARLARVRRLVDRWVEYQRFRGFSARGVDPTVGSACWWPYHARRVDLIGDNASCGELDFFDWELDEPEYRDTIAPAVAGRLGMTRRMLGVLSRLTWANLNSR